MKILIIKLGAKGDVVRTLPILPALKEKYPMAEIYWITEKDNISLFKNNPYIREVYAAGDKIDESFDHLYNFDIEKPALNLVQQIHAKKKYGFYLEKNYPAAFNIGAEYYLNTLFDDNLKRENKKTYQDMLFESADLIFHGEHCPIYLSDEEKQYAWNFAERNRINIDNLIGIHMGASKRWPSKVWSLSKIKEFIEKSSKSGYDVLLFAGRNEKEEQAEISKYLKEKNIKFFQNDSDNSDREFCALVNLCNFMVCSDSFSLHVSLALKKKTFGLFFCTSPYEIEGYGLLKKIISPYLNNFFPERMDQYNEELVNSISADEVFNIINNQNKNESKK